MALALIFLAACTHKKPSDPMQEKVARFHPVELKADLSQLTDNERKAIGLLIDAAMIIDDIFWSQAFDQDKETFLANLPDEAARQFALINYGPWDRLDGNKPFVEGFGEKPKSANFYPTDMTSEEFEAFSDPDKASLYTLLRRDEGGKLICIPYSVAYREKHEKAAEMMRQAAGLVDDEGFKKYINLRVEALLTDNYQPSDFAWMEMKTSKIDFVVGPIETYEDRLFGYKAAHESFVLLKDLDWSTRLEKYSSMLPDLQKGLPVAEEYKRELPGSDSDMNVYEALYFAGDCNAGSKTIAINLPNDEEVQIQKGSRKLQLKNAMKAKFDNILVPMASLLIDPAQQKHINFDAFFENITFHEVAHGMGINTTINGKGSVREALKEQYSALEEAKADIMGLYLVTKLYELGEISSGEVMDNYVTFFAGIFRSSRFGAASAHGRANMMNLKFFANSGAFVLQKNGTYKVNFEEMKAAVARQVERILTIQGNGDYDNAKSLLETDGVMTDQLRKDLDRVNATGIPVDIVFKQGKELLGL